jgi:hypothetical protein
MSEKPFKFLEEKPLQTTEEFSNSKFGHEEIANTLVKITKECPAPFTVGLFAKWGSGKSTVANSLLKKLPKENIPVVLFDVWKHEGDALRRTFLKETVRQLKAYGKDFFDQDFVLDEKLEQRVSRSSKSKFIFESEMFQQLGPWIIGSLSLIGVGGYLADKYNLVDSFSFFVSSLFGSITAGGLLLWLVKQSLQLFSTETVNYGVDKFADPHQFEEEFGRILCGLKNPRVLIIFDNLDRVMHDKVAEVLATVKTFLEPADLANNQKEVIFLVPCDAKAIKQHLSSVYGSSDPSAKHTFDPDEFLRKFFNTIVWIPDFIPSELESFARSQLKETNVELLDNDYVAWIITKAFRNNPRQVIQFTNILLANYLLVVEREGENKDFEVGFLKNNIPQLTKYLVLNQLFPEEMDALREKKILDLSEVTPEDLNNISTKKAFLSFVEQTKNIPITDLRAFFTLRRSDQEKKFPGFSSFIALLEDSQVDDSKKYFAQLGDFSQADFVSNFSQAIKEELEGKTNPVSTINLIHTLFAILGENKLILTSTLYEEIDHILSDRCKDQLHTISPDAMDEILLGNTPAYRGHIITQWLKVAEDVLSGANKFKSNREFVTEVFSLFAKRPDYLNATQNKKAQQLLANNLAGDVPIAKTLAASPDAQTKILDGEYVRNFTAAIPNGGVLDDVSARLDVVNTLNDSLLKAAGIDFILNKYIELQTAENSHSKPESFPEKIKIMNPLRSFLRDRKTLVSSASTAPKDGLVDIMIAGFNALPDHEQRSIFVPVLFDLRAIGSTAKIAQIESHLNGYIAAVSPAKFEEMFAQLSEENRAQFFETPLYTAGANRAVGNDAFRRVFFPKLSDARKKQFLIQMFNGDFEQAIQFIESLEKKELKHVWGMFDTVWTKFESFSVPQKQRVFKFVNNHEAGNIAEMRDVLTTKIIATLTSTDQALQKVGLDAVGEANSHLAEPKKRMIAKDSFDWLKKPETTTKYQPSTLRAILSENARLNEEEQKEFVQFVFDEIIRKSGNHTHIADAFVVLKELKPKYEDRKANYDDVGSRLETEADQNIKTALITGLTSLTPDKTNKGNEDFWKWVEEQVNHGGNL